MLAFIHLDIKNIPQNFASLTTYLETIRFDFPFIGITETWLTDYNCTLDSMPGYSFVDNHRQNKIGDELAYL